MKLNAKLLRFFILAALAAVASAQNIDSAELLSRVKARVRENVRTIPKFVCRQKIERQSFATGHNPRSCGVLVDSNTAKGSLLTSDRAVLDVMLSTNTEMFAWPGALSFDADDPDDLLGGGFSGNGDFATFLISIFTLDAATFHYEGPCETGSCARYNFDIPASASNYVVKTRLDESTVGYHGAFDVDPQSGELIRLTVIPTDLSKAIPSACDVRTQMSYARTAEFTIPALAEKQYLSKDGTRYLDRVSYEGCRQYSSESALKFEDQGPVDEAPSAATALPPSGTELQLQLSSNIDSERGAAGEAIEATLVRSVQDTQGHAIAAGTVFRGHLARLQTIYSPREQVVVAFKFDRMVLNGAPVPVNLTPVLNDEKGAEVFTFPGRKRVRSKGLRMRWRVVS